MRNGLQELGNSIVSTSLKCTMAYHDHLTGSTAPCVTPHPCNNDSLASKPSSNRSSRQIGPERSLPSSSYELNLSHVRLLSHAQEELSLLSWSLTCERPKTDISI